MIEAGDRIEVMIPEERIRERVEALAARIAADYRDRPLTVLGVLKGSVFFLVDLLRRVDLPLRLEFLRAASYGAGTVSCGTVDLGPLAPMEEAFVGRHVLIVDDILDSGRTLDAIRTAVGAHGPASVRTCVLVDKRKERAVAFEADYRAFEIPDVFIVGYGLDYAERYRNLPYIAVLTPGGSG